MTTPATPPAAAPATPPVAAPTTPPEVPPVVAPVTPPATTPETPPVAPETYDIKLPDGSRLDPSRVESIAALAKERKLSNEAAQEILTREHEAVEGFAAVQTAAYQKEQEGWATSLKTDKEIGGDNYNKSIELASRVVKQFGTPEFSEALNRTGLGNHPELVRVFARVAKSLGEDTLVLPGAAPAAGPKDVRELFYPEPSKK